MSFLKHSPCNACGSRNNLAEYTEGSAYCFGCGFYRPPTLSPYLAKQTPTTHDLALPDDASKDYGQEAIAWITQYGLSTSELIKNNVLWSEAKKQLIFTFKDAEGQLLLWQARNFGPWAKTKYFTKGQPESVLPIFDGPSNGKLVLVEDCVSAIKIGRQAASMPVLGSDLSKAKLTRLAAFWGPARGIVVWLDGDMYHKAQRMADRLCLLGCKASAWYSKCDPKTYDDRFIQKMLDFS